MGPIDVDPWQIQEGIRVEMEHTRDPQIAYEIALDHLYEVPDYYTRLRRVESGLGGFGFGGWPWWTWSLLGIGVIGVAALVRSKL